MKAIKVIKGKGILATALAVVLSIGMFSALFIGANNVAYAAANGSTVSFPATANTHNAAVRESVVPAGYQTPSLTVNEIHSFYEKTANTLTAEAAAELGAQYIWEVFGVSVDGKTVEMSYGSFPSNTRTHWYGYVIPAGGSAITTLSINENNEAVIEKASTLFTFSIDAVTGARISVWQDMENRFDDMANDPTITLEEMNAITVPWLTEMLAGNNPLFTRFTPEQIEMYEQMAKGYAEKHFNTTDVVSVKYEAGSPYLFARAADGRVVVRNYIVTFAITDNTGREAHVSVITGTTRLHNINTNHNDIIPGFVPLDEVVYIER